jgi:hypothetical protein
VDSSRHRTVIGPDESQKWPTAYAFEASYALLRSVLLTDDVPRRHDVAAEGSSMPATIREWESAEIERSSKEASRIGDAELLLGETNV